MNGAKTRFLIAVTVVSILFLGVFISVTLNSDFGKLQVKIFSINDGSRELKGLLYQPSSSPAANPCPAIILAHGIGGSKEMMSGIGLELARRGFVVFSLDLFGHGGSEETIREGADEPSFGVSSAVKYLRSQSIINGSAIGLVGHSLGGGAIRAIFAVDGGIGASVLIAGGLGEVTEVPVYDILNSTFPKNLLVIVGKYDVLSN